MQVFKKRIMYCVNKWHQISYIISTNLCCGDKCYHYNNCVHMRERRIVRTTGITVVRAEVLLLYMEKKKKNSSKNQDKIERKERKKFKKNQTTASAVV